MTDLERIREMSSRLLDPEFAIRIFETDWDAKIIVNEQLEIQFVNAQTELMFGYPRVELVGNHVNMLLPEALRDRHTTYTKLFIEDPRVRPMGSDMQLKALHRNGKEMNVRIYLVPVPWHDGLRVVATIRKKGLDA